VAAKRKHTAQQIAAQPRYRLSFDAVDEYLGRCGVDNIDPDYDPLWPCNVARSTGLSTKAVQRARVDGLSVWQAERVAVGLGLLPYSVSLWGDEWCEKADAVADLVERQREQNRQTQNRKRSERRQLVAA
jgi:hypothetical protein